MNLAAPFVRRPVGTTLLTIGLALAGVSALLRLPVAPLPQVDFPTISVSATLPGASPETMASSVARPLERRLGLIADVNEMTSSSRLGTTSITLQFNLGRDIDGAARDVQAAINAARADLPTTLTTNPTYRKLNPADAPILILALTSKTRAPAQIYDAVSNTVQQRLSQVDGVGNVELGGGSLPAVRVEIAPFALSRFGISLEDVRTAINAANPNRPKGTIEGNGQRFQIYTNDSGTSAADYRDLIIASRDNTTVRLSDIANVIDAAEDTRTLGLFNGEPAVVAIVFREPGANIIATVDRVREALPLLRAQLPQDISLNVASDRTTTIRASLHDVEITLVIALVLVVLIVGLFLQSVRAALVPAVAVSVSILGTLGVMYLVGFSLNNLSLMALTIATGFVVDDAIVVLENVRRHMEAGEDRLTAALSGVREVGFTVLSISLSLIAVFVPLLFMGGIVGRLFREFAVTLSIAVLTSLVVSLTTTPMMCALILKPSLTPRTLEGRSQQTMARARAAYGRALDATLAHPVRVVLVLAAVVALNVYLFAMLPKGFFPQQDTGQLNGGLRADQSVSFTAMRQKLRQIAGIVGGDPAIENVVGFIGGSRAGGGFMFVTLKKNTPDGSQTVIDRLRPRLAKVAGATLFLSPVQDVRMGGRQANASFQYTLKSDSATDLRRWSTRLYNRLKQSHVLTDVDSDALNRGLESFVTIDRHSAARLGISSRDIDNTLNDAFGQRRVTTLYRNLNQYHVVMEVAPEFAQSPLALRDIYVPATGFGPTPVSVVPSRDPTTTAEISTSVTNLAPLAAFAHFADRAAPTAINHQNTSIAATLAFNLADGSSLSDAAAAIAAAERDIGMPSTVRGSFQGTAKAFQDSLRDEPLLIAAALATIYIVLGILYESYVHPITVLSTLPPAGVGAALALLLLHMEFSVIALIGVILLIGIVKKNAILIIDFAIRLQREDGVTARDAIHHAALQRLRPILMTTLAAGLGALPLAIGFGEGAELRRPLGIAIIGGLLISQLLTLFTTPAIYLLLDRGTAHHAATQPVLPRSPQEPA